MAFVHSFTFTPPARYGSAIGPWTDVRVEYLNAGVWTPVETLDLAGDHVTPSGLDADPAAPQSRQLTTEESPVAEGQFRVVWVDGDADESPPSEAVTSPSGSAITFATSADVAVRLGRDLTDAETAAVDGTLEVIAGLIRDAVDKPASWEPNPAPAALRELSIQKAIGALANPRNVASYSLQLGAHSRSETFQRSQDGGLLLSDAEGRDLRLAVYGTNAGSSSPRSMIDRLQDLRENRDVDEPQ